MLNITATHINYLHVCHRKLWLFSHALQMEHTSDAVTEGKLIGESTYPQRAEKYTEVEFDGVKIDFYDAKNRVVHEIKKSAKIEEAHRAQVKYYLYVLAKNGIADVRGILEYPKQRHTEGVELEADDWDKITGWLAEIDRIVNLEDCPKVLDKPVCKNCSYFDFCYSDE
jgi:CRISPR-associated exonuclease Cas4